MLSHLGTATSLLAVALLPAQDQSPAQGAEFGEASPIALVVIIVLALATALLIRSMSKRIRRLPESFDEPDAQQPSDAQQPADDTHDEGARS